MLHQDSIVKIVCPEIGYGVFATAFIPKGTITFVKDEFDIQLNEEQYEALATEYRQIMDKYSYMESDGTRVLSWDHAKYVNHSCMPNTISTGYGFEIALRDIEPGEEITDEYGIFMDGEMQCFCGSENCRKLITSGDYDKNSERWDTMIRDALTCFTKVSQPLLKYLDSDVYADIMRYLNTGLDYRSISNLCYVPVLDRVENGVTEQGQSHQVG